MSVIRPDGIKLELISTSLPYSNVKIIHEDRIFSTDAMIKKKIMLQSEVFNFELGNVCLQKILFFQKRHQMNR